MVRKSLVMDPPASNTVHPALLGKLLVKSYETMKRALKATGGAFKVAHRVTHKGRHAASVPRNLVETEWTSHDWRNASRHKALGHQPGQPSHYRAAFRKETLRLADEAGLSQPNRREHLRNHHLSLGLWLAFVLTRRDCNESNLGQGLTFMRFNEWAQYHEVGMVYVRKLVSQVRTIDGGRLTLLGTQADEGECSMPQLAPICDTKELITLYVKGFIRQRLGVKLPPDTDEIFEAHFGKPLPDDGGKKRKEPPKGTTEVPLATRVKAGETQGFREGEMDEVDPFNLADAIPADAADWELDAGAMNEADPFNLADAIPADVADWELDPEAMDLDPLSLADVVPGHKASWEQAQDTTEASLAGRIETEELQGF